MFFLSFLHYLPTFLTDRTSSCPVAALVRPLSWTGQELSRSHDVGPVWVLRVDPGIGVSAALSRTPVLLGPIQALSAEGVHRCCEVTRRLDQKNNFKQVICWIILYGGFFNLQFIFWFRARPRVAGLNTESHLKTATRIPPGLHLSTKKSNWKKNSFCLKKSTM